MRYDNITKAVFLSRPNRFTARVEINGTEETVHVKNTGRCRELLIPGAEVWITAPGAPGRKTRYDLVSVRTAGGSLFNIDSQAPNKAVKEWLEMSGFDRVIPEYDYGESRLDFFMAKGEDRYLTEVKGCTLVRDGVGYFPDAPTARGAKHLRELARAAGAGYRAAAAFVIQTEGVAEVRPNTDTDPAFSAAWEEAVRAGVRILSLPCRVTPDSIEIMPGTTFGAL